MKDANKRPVNKFEQLENNKEDERSWEQDWLTTGLPKRAFTNPITSGFVLLAEQFMIPVYKTIDKIKNWWQV